MSRHLERFYDSVDLVYSLAPSRYIHGVFPSRPHSCGAPLTALMYIEYWFQGALGDGSVLHGIQRLLSGEREGAGAGCVDRTTQGKVRGGGDGFGVTGGANKGQIQSSHSHRLVIFTHFSSPLSLFHCTHPHTWRFCPNPG